MQLLFWKDWISHDKLWLDRCRCLPLRRGRRSGPGQGQAVCVVDTAIVCTIKFRKVLQYQQLTMEVVQQLGRMFKADFKLITDIWWAEFTWSATKTTQTCWDTWHRQLFVLATLKLVKLPWVWLLRFAELQRNKVAALKCCMLLPPASSCLPAFVA